MNKLGISASHACRREARKRTATRAFSTSSPWRRRGELASFPTTSSTELDAIIRTFRNNVFIPAHLSKGYRDMIYKPDQQYYLTGEEPVKAKIRVKLATPDAPIPTETEDIPPPTQDQSKIPQATAPPVYPQKKPSAPKESMLLTPLNSNVDEPNTRAQYIQMLSLMQTPEDFLVIPEFLRELRASRKPVTAAMLAKTVRRGAELESLQKVIQMFQNVQKIGAPIRHPFIMDQLMMAVVDGAAKRMWSKAALDESLKQIDMILIMATDPKQVAEWTSREKSAEDTATLPYVWGTAMAFEAVRALKYGKREFGFGDERGLEPRTTKFLELVSNYSLEPKSTRWNVRNTFLAKWAPTFVGTKFVIQALGSEAPLSKELQKVLAQLEPLVISSVQSIEEGAAELDSPRGPKLIKEMEQSLSAVAPPEEELLVESEAVEVTDAQLSESSSNDTQQTEKLEGVEKASGNQSDKSV